MSKELDAEAFGEIFAGMSVTLLAARPLRRELARLRAALPPGAPSDLPARPPYLDEVLDLTIRLQAMLPAEPPSDVEFLRRRLAPLHRSKSALARRLAAESHRLIRTIPDPTSLWLVPAVWSHRMGMLLDGQTFPAQVRNWAVQHWRRPGSV